MLTRRKILTGAAAALCAGGRTAQAAQPRIDALIERAATLPTMARRMGFISRALLGSPYVSHSLIGGPATPEQFVTRDDAFDCVTFCEAVLAAARSRKPEDYPERLRQIRYAGGVVSWRTRNHYFSEWCENNVANGVCRPVALPGGVPMEKMLTYMAGLEPRLMSLIAATRANVVAHRARLATGDIIGFLSRQPGLDYFHTGIIVTDEQGGVWLRHAAKLTGRVQDTPLARFLAVWKVDAVTLLRPQDGCPEDMIA